ncbi:MAG: hypothetical protein M9893_02315 [Pyrinomonadaceae bacterium]|nr:hypothetical protein [Pyrinomonadaceae bacterium]
MMRTRTFRSLRAGHGESSACWGINAILSDGDIDVKNRWDHRHHALDALVVALCDRGLYQMISKKLAGTQSRYDTLHLKRASANRGEASWMMSTADGKDRSIACAYTKGS